MPDVVHLPRSEAPRVSIVIPSAANPDLLFACIRSLERHLPASIPTETIVVLDGAPEGSAARIGEAAPGVLVVASAVRLGLARAANRGRRRARGEFIALLHDDSEIEAGWLQALVAAADAHPEAGAFGGSIAFPDGAPQTAGVVVFRDGAALPPWPGLTPEGAKAVRCADFCASNALFIRTAAWDAAGGLDPRYFPAWFVDADLAMSLRAAGWSVLVVPEAKSRHRRGSSARREFREWASGLNRGAFVAKWTEALKDYEPWDGGSAASFASALERARARGALLARGPRRSGTPPTGAPPDALEERDALAQDLDLQREWVRRLDARLEECRETAKEGRVELEAARASASAAVEAAREAEARLRSLEGLFWWRLYRRLLPVLRPLRALASAFSRRAAPSRTE